MGFKILKKMHNAGGGGGKHHRDDCDYSSSSDGSDEEDESYDSFEDENYVVKDDPNDDEVEDDEERSEYSSDNDDETEIDPELLCPTCGTQTHEYVRKGTIIKKWKRLPVEDDDIVDAQTGDCVACKKERLEKMKSEWLDDIPTLPEGLFKKRTDQQSNEFDDDNDEEKEGDDQESGNAPITTQGERYRNAIRNRHAKKASFGSTSADTNNEEQSSLYDESTFSCGISINSDGRSIRTGRSKLDTLTEVPEREETSVEESENSSDDGSEDTEEVEEELDEVEEEIGDQLTKLEEEVSAYRSNGAMATTKTVDEMSRQTPSVATGKFDDFLADHEASPFVKTAEPDQTTKCEESITGQNGANDGGDEMADPSVADVSNVLEQYASAKDQISTKQRMAEMGRTFRGMVASGIGNKKKKNGLGSGDDQGRDETGANQDSNVFGEATTPPEAQADETTPDWAAGLIDQPQVIAPTNTAVEEFHGDGIILQDGEKDPQLFYNEAVAAVAAAGAPTGGGNPADEAKKTKKKTFKSPFYRKLKTTSDQGAVEDAVADNNIVAEQPRPIGGTDFGFPDLLPDGGERGKKSKRFGITLNKSKKKDDDEPGVDQMEENPFLPPNISPPKDITAPKQQRKTISSMFPDNILGGIPEDRQDDSPPPPVLEIATGPEDEDEDEDIANPNTTDVDHLIRGIQRTVDDPRLARKFLISLRTMSIHHPNRLGIAEAGGIHAIVICMRRFKRESSVAKQGCAALQNLVCADKNEQRCVEEGALDAIVRAMMNHSRSPGTQEHGAAALRNMTAGSLTNRTAVAEAGGIEALIRAMKTHRRNPDVQDKCCAALANICNKHRANRVAIGEAGGITHVVEALRRYGYRKKAVAEKGIRCLLNLSHTSRNVEMMKWEEGIEGLVLGVAHRHGGKSKEWALKIFLKM